MQIDERSFEETQPSDTTEEQVEELADSGNAEEGLAEDEVDGEGEESSDSTKRSKVQKRIDEITKARREAERERDFWRLQAQQREMQSQPQINLQRPTLDQYDYDQEAYLEALADYKVQEKLVEQFHASQRLQQQQSASQQDVEFKQREYEVASEFPDYHQKVYANDVPITDTMAQAIRSDENGARVAYFLATYKDIAHRVSQLTPREQFLAIGDISEKISQAQSSEGLKPSRVSNAPPPAQTLSGRGSVVNKSPDKMTTEEFMAWRNRQLSKRK